MKPLRRVAIGVVVLTVIAGAALALLPNDEPRFQGKYISHYLRQMEIVDDGTNRDLRWAAFQEATNALQQMGPAAIEWLAANIETPPQPRRLSLRA